MHMIEQGSRYLERYSECRDALEYPVQIIIDQAIAGGWTHHEVSTALINLALELFPDYSMAPYVRQLDLAPH